MMQAGILSFLFLSSAIIQVSLVHSLGHPLGLLPVHFAIGILVLHRAGGDYGAAWFLVSALFLPLIGFDVFPWASYLLTALLGILLTKRVFTNRSVYALLGIGTSLFLVTLVLQWILTSVRFDIGLLFLQIGFLIILLYSGFGTSRILETILKPFFLPRQHGA